MSKKISFVIRTYNESAFIGLLLDTLNSQAQVPFEWEVTVVDSGSTDGTVPIVKSRPVRLIEIPKIDFDYSTALNLGIERSSGELLVILSAHSIPCANDWLARLVSLFDDPAVAGVYTRQVPWPGAYWREVVRIRRMFGNSRQVFDPSNRPRQIPFSNAASCIRRKAWEEHQFCLPAAEDVEWASWAVANGYKIIYEADTSVYHSHNETSRQAARRLIDLEKAADLGASRHRRFLLTMKQSAGAVLRDAREIWEYEPTMIGRLPLLWESTRRSYWFVRDFRR